MVALYDKLPELLDASLKLSVRNAALFGEMKAFYKAVRNPIFQGGQIGVSGDDYDHVASAFELIADVYDWIDSWYTAFPAGWQHMRATSKSIHATWEAARNNSTLIRGAKLLPSSVLPGLTRLCATRP